MSSEDTGKHPDQRVGVFVDVQNMYYSARAVHNKKVNFKKVLEAAVDGRHLVRAFAYGITTEEAHEEEFHDALTKQGFEVQSKPLQTFAGGQKKGDWDVGIAMDILRLEPKIDVAVLVSGDGDFVPLVQFSKEKGLRFEVMGFRESTSSALVEVADAFTNFSEKPRTYLIASGRLGGRLLGSRHPAPQTTPNAANRSTSQPSRSTTTKPTAKPSNPPHSAPRRKPRIIH